MLACMVLPTRCFREPSRSPWRWKSWGFCEMPMVPRATSFWCACREKAEYTGVVAGMSGSPVYLDGKLAGALAFRIGEFSKEPIARRNPDRRDARDQRHGQSPGNSPAQREGRRRALLERHLARVIYLPSDGVSKDYANYLKPIETPLVFNGFSQETMHASPQFAQPESCPSWARVRSATRNSRSPGTRLRRQRHPGARRHGYRRHLHRHLHGSAASAGVRTSAAAVRHRGPADDQGASAGHATFAAQRIQDRQHYRAGGRIRSGPSHRHHGRVWQSNRR